MGTTYGDVHWRARVRTTFLDTLECGSFGLLGHSFNLRLEREWIRGKGLDVLCNDFYIFRNRVGDLFLALYGAGSEVMISPPLESNRERTEVEAYTADILLDSGQNFIGIFVQSGLHRDEFRCIASADLV